MLDPLILHFTDITLITFISFSSIFAIVILNERLYYRTIFFFIDKAIFLYKTVWRECHFSLSFCLSQKKENGKICLFLFPNSNKRIFFAFTDTICRIDSSIGNIGEIFFFVKWIGEEAGKIWNLGREQVSAARCVSEDERDKFIVFFCENERRMDTAALNFRNEMHSERDANKTPTHRRLPRKHARRGIVNIWTSKRGERRLIGGCWLFSGWPLFSTTFLLKNSCFFSQITDARDKKQCDHPTLDAFQMNLIYYINCG